MGEGLTGRGEHPPSPVSISKEACNPHPTRASRSSPALGGGGSAWRCPLKIRVWVCLAEWDVITQRVCVVSVLKYENSPAIMREHLPTCTTIPTTGILFSPCARTLLRG